jgi:hypothetical protein
VEARIDLVRIDILKWIGQGGAEGMDFSFANLTHAAYRSAMERYLAPHAVIVGVVTSKQEAATKNPELRVSVDGQPKTCRGFMSKRDRKPHILCNFERFSATGEADQYRLVHHEYAGLAGVEQNLGASSDYTLSNQITDYLVPETILRLSAKRPVPTSLGSDGGCEIVPSGGKFGLYVGGRLIKSAGAMILSDEILELRKAGTCPLEGARRECRVRLESFDEKKDSGRYQVVVSGQPASYYSITDAIAAFNELRAIGNCDRSMWACEVRPTPEHGGGYEVRVGNELLEFNRSALQALRRVNALKGSGICTGPQVAVDTPEMK